jgi:hypothetical protein
MLYPDADSLLKLVYKYKVLCDIEDLSGYRLGETSEFITIVKLVDNGRAGYCQELAGRAGLSALYGTYIVTLKS